MRKDLREARARYAADIMGWTRAAGFDDPRVEAAFAAVPREAYLMPPPWWIVGPGGLVDAETSEAAELYADVLVVLDLARGINNGQPSLHAAWLTAVAPLPGETIVQVGAGSGYYTAILAELVGESGRVEAFEIEPDLAAIARTHLAHLEQVRVHAASGAGDLPMADVVYVAAGAVAPPASWLRALKPAGRLIFPWDGPGATLLVRRTEVGFAARLLFAVRFIGCVGMDARVMRTRGIPSRAVTETRSIWFRGDREPDETATAIYEEVWLSASEL